MTHIPIIPLPPINELFVPTESPRGEFHPAKHTKMNYATQRRIAKKNKRIRARSKK